MRDEYMVKSDTFPPDEMTHYNHRSRLRQGQRRIPKDTLRDAAVYLT
jgi:hypothetical protein